MPLDSVKHFEEKKDVAFRNSKGKCRPAAQLPTEVKVADTHCHLGMLRNPALALARAAVHNVSFIECMTDPSKDPEASQDYSAQECYDLLPSWLDEARLLLQEWFEAGEIACLPQMPLVRMACGVHPHNAKEWEAAEPLLRSLLQRSETTCLGEIGLDFHYDLSPRSKQAEVFVRQLEIANEYDLPVALHIREAHAKALQILQEHGIPRAGAILHCFNLDTETLIPFMELGCYIAFGGPLTFKKSFALRAAVTEVNPKYLLTETDAPFMAPEPLRGTECMPCYTTYTLRCLLDCFGYSGAERALELMTPRSIDVEEGKQCLPLANPDFNHIQCALSETEFAARLYSNALEILKGE